jgi:Uma2 family endonuclease
MLNDSMAALPMPKMTVDEYLAWAEGRSGRYELYAGSVYQMTPERAVHARVKYAVQTALASGIKQANLNCEMLPDGMTVRVDRHTAHEPDALVYCGPKLPKAAIEVPNPVIVVEVLSPSTRHIDAAVKLGGYGSIQSICHYLIFDPEGRPTLHHERTGADTFVTRIVRGGMLRLDPPGLEIELDPLHALAEERRDS